MDFASVRADGVAHLVAVGVADDAVHFLPRCLVGLVCLLFMVADRILAKEVIRLHRGNLLLAQVAEVPPVGRHGRLVALFMPRGHTVGICILGVPHLLRAAHVIGGSRVSINVLAADGPLHGVLAGRVGGAERVASGLLLPGVQVALLLGLSEDLCGVELVFPHALFGRYLVDRCVALENRGRVLEVRANISLLLGLTHKEVVTSTGLKVNQSDQGTYLRKVGISSRHY